VKVFDAMSELHLLPLHRIDEDAVRQRLDTRFGLEVLGLPPSVVESGGPVELLRMKLAQEPSIRGGIATTPEDQDE